MCSRMGVMVDYVRKGFSCKESSCYDDCIDVPWLSLRGKVGQMVKLLHTLILSLGYLVLNTVGNNKICVVNYKKKGCLPADCYGEYFCA